jgi:hypothetical protein
MNNSHAYTKHTPHVDMTANGTTLRIHAQE